MDEVTKDLLEALLIVARMAEGLKKPCGMDPESPRAIRNAQYMNISYAARAAIARAEAALAEPQPDADGWIPWAGGECPVGQDTLVDLRYRDSEKWPDKLGVPSGYCHLESSYPYWRNDGGSCDIIAYRIVRK